MIEGQPQPLSGRFDQVPIDSILFGPEAANQIAIECDRLEMNRILLIVSSSLSKTVNLPKIFHDYTDGRVVAVYDGSKPHVPHNVVLDAAWTAREAAIDGIVSVGGGSPIDLAKAVALCLAEDIRNLDDLARYRVRFAYPDQISVPAMKGTGLPQIAVSTTLSAAEFTGYIGITDTDRKMKDTYFHATLVPRVVVLDPTLAVHTPRLLWGSTGLRSVDHAIEGLCSIEAQPISDALCSDSLERLARYLPISVQDKTDLHAAGQCQLAAWESSIASASVNLGLSHAIGHQLGARCDVPHGVTSCVILPAVLEYNLEYTWKAQAAIAGILAVAMRRPVLAGGGASGLVRDFVSSLGLPTRLSEVRVTRADFPLIARGTLEDMCAAANPRPIVDELDVVEVLETAY